MYMDRNDFILTFNTSDNKKVFFNYYKFKDVSQTFRNMDALCGSTHEIDCLFESEDLIFVLSLIDGIYFENDKVQPRSYLNLINIIDFYNLDNVSSYYDSIGGYIGQWYNDVFTKYNDEKNGRDFYDIINMREIFHQADLNRKIKT